MRLTIALLVLLGGVPAARANGFGPWEHVRTDDGIVVHRRKVDGFDLHEFRGRGVIEAPIERVLGVLSDAPRRVEWMERCVQSYAVARLSETSQVEYNRTSGTWPVKDRDVVVMGETYFDVDKREVRVTFRNATSHAVPRQDGAVRIPYLRGHWILRPTDGGRSTWVEYQAHADPAGSIPTFIVNLVSKTLPYKTLLKLRDQVGRVRYPDLERRLAAHPPLQSILGRTATIAATK